MCTDIYYAGVANERVETIHKSSRERVHKIKRKNKYIYRDDYYNGFYRKPCNTLRNMRNI